MQPFMFYFLPQSLNAKPTSERSISVLFKERQFPRSVYSQRLRPCGRVAFSLASHFIGATLL